MSAIQLLELVFNRHSFKYVFLTFSFPRTLRHSIKWFFCPSSGSSLVPLQSLQDPPLISSLTKYYTTMTWHPPPPSNCPQTHDTTFPDDGGYQRRFTMSTGRAKPMSSIQVDHLHNTTFIRRRWTLL